jgi:hypothetical protein
LFKAWEFNLEIYWLDSKNAWDVSSVYERNQMRGRLSSWNTSVSTRVECDPNFETSKNNQLNVMLSFLEELVE